MGCGGERAMGCGGGVRWGVRVGCGGVWPPAAPPPEARDELRQSSGLARAPPASSSPRRAELVRASPSGTPRQRLFTPSGTPRQRLFTRLGASSLTPAPLPAASRLVSHASTRSRTVRFMLGYEAASAVGEAASRQRGQMCCSHSAQAYRWVRDKRRRGRHVTDRRALVVGVKHWWQSG
jgi:hypothetical protein